ncbi:hypothetical protein [Bacillus sp. OK048]|uniref:hypothetical protein n=1 Tax=Bacillus sp. OK048 TaxID=1882761 RepID=UPI000881CA07|nr:hypothetical protein [Bacillus sp. OK048]SDN52653.1 hypothetical protein SAMN05443253_11369 [Bacillus sp. OK048]
MNLSKFIESIIPNVEEDQVLNCYQVKDLNSSNLYKIIILSNHLEYIPPFEMKTVWEKIKNALCPGGLIIIKTVLTDHPNELAEGELVSNSFRCNKQTGDTLLRSCLKQDLIMAESEEEYFALMRKEDLSFLSEEQKGRFEFHHQNWLIKYGLEVKGNYLEEDVRQIVPGPGRVMIGCVAENNKKYQTQALRLVQSIRWFGESMAGANIFVCMVDKADPDFVKELEKWGVFVRIVHRFSVSHPPSNKLRLFELPEVSSYDTVMLLDCDTVIVQDPSPFMDGNHFQAEMAAGLTVPNNIFRNLFSHYGLPMPKENYLTAFSKQKTIWYCNAGVLIFPSTLIQSFFPIWKKYTTDLSGKKTLLGKYYFFCEQASLSIAFAAHPLPFARLPLIMNFHLTPNISSEMKKSDPVIIHYHKMNDETGFLKHISKNPFTNNRIKLFNQRLKRYLENDI